MTSNPDYDVLVDNLRARGMSYSEIFSMLQPKITSSIPLEILNNRKLGMLESVCVYLKDEKDMAYSEIAKILNRDDRTIWASYNKAKKKVAQKGAKIGATKTSDRQKNRGGRK